MRGSRRAARLVMGVPKRKASGGQDGAAARASTAKRARTEELTGVRFKAQLRDPQGAGPGECRGEESVSLRNNYHTLAAYIFLISQFLCERSPAWFIWSFHGLSEYSQPVSPKG